MGPAGPKFCYRWSCMGQGLAPNYATNELAWAQDCHQTMLLMSLHGPSSVTKLCYRRSCMGPGLSPNNSTDELAWAQDWHQTMVPMVSAWAQDWHQTMVLMVLYGP